MKARHVLYGLTLMVMAMTMNSCDRIDDISGDPSRNAVSRNYPSAVVTLKKTYADQLFLQVDDSTMMYPINLQNYKYNKEVRAFVNMSIPSEEELKKYPDFLADMPNVFVNWVDTIRTKDMAADLGDKNRETYGSTPVEIVKDFSTVCEDGYLTLRFRTYFQGKTTHVLNLVRGKNPYEVCLYHNANGETQGTVADGVIAFRLNDLPDTEGKTVDLKLRYQSFSGEKTIIFRYKTRK